MVRLTPFSVKVDFLVLYKFTLEPYHYRNFDKYSRGENERFIFWSVGLSKP